MADWSDKFPSSGRSPRVRDEFRAHHKCPRIESVTAICPGHDVEAAFWLRRLVAAAALRQVNLCVRRRNHTAPRQWLIQFCIAEALHLMTVAAMVFAMEHAIPYWTVGPVALLVASCHVSLNARSADLAWGLFAVAWLLALFDTTRGVVACWQQCMPPLPTSGEFRDAIFRTCRESLMLPLFLSFPSAYFAARIPHGSASVGPKWVWACPLIAFANVTLAVMFVAVLARYWDM